VPGKIETAADATVGLRRATAAPCASRSGTIDGVRLVAPTIDLHGVALRVLPRQATGEPADIAAALDIGTSVETDDPALAALGSDADPERAAAA
jgi:hypothetical protein